MIRHYISDARSVSNATTAYDSLVGHVGKILRFAAEFTTLRVGAQHQYTNAITLPRRVPDAHYCGSSSSDSNH